MIATGLHYIVSFAIMFIPMGFFGFTMIAFPGVWRKWGEWRYTTSKIKVDSLQLRSDGAWRAFGIGIMLLAIFLAWYTSR